MENGIEPKRTISLNWDDPWKKYDYPKKQVLKPKSILSISRENL